MKDIKVLLNKGQYHALTKQLKARLDDMCWQASKAEEDGDAFLAGNTGTQIVELRESLKVIDDAFLRAKWNIQEEEDEPGTGHRQGAD